MSDETITKPQARRFWAIALDTGYNREGVQRLLAANDCAEAEQITKDEYDELCALAEDEDLAFKYNRDPNTRDLFTGETPDV